MLLNRQSAVAADHALIGKVIFAANNAPNVTVAMWGGQGHTAPTIRLVGDWLARKDHPGDLKKICRMIIPVPAKERDARAVAHYIYDAFYSPRDARARTHPARVCTPFIF